MERKGSYKKNLISDQLLNYHLLLFEVYRMGKSRAFIFEKPQTGCCLSRFAGWAYAS